MSWSEKGRKRVRGIFAALSVLIGATTFLAGEGPAPVPQAEAVVGMPFTPMSYAGVARRTTRRAYYYSAAAAPVAVAPQPQYVPTLPSSSCARVVVNGVTAYDCSGSLYRPVYDGPNLVYMPFAP